MSNFLIIPFFVTFKGALNGINIVYLGFDLLCPYKRILIHNNSDYVVCSKKVKPVLGLDSNSRLLFVFSL